MAKFKNSTSVKVDMTAFMKVAQSIESENTWDNDMPEEDIAVKITNLSKVYKIYKKSWYRVLNAFSDKVKYKEFYALKNVSVNIKKGETIGILGTNGSGKSTILKAITGVLTPTNGSIEVKGRIAAMLELTSGFDNELTGYENIFLKATTMGIPDEDIAKRVDDIADFADIGDYLYQPVRTYSSGMKSRLGFAVSVNVNPDILIVDEVLAVGDDTFKMKCLAKMEEFRMQGKTILFVSHSLFTIKGFCTKAMWLKDGELIVKGDTAPVAKLYEDYLKELRTLKKIKAKEEIGDEEAIVHRSDIIDFEQCNFYNVSHNLKNKIKFGYNDPVTIEIVYDLKKEIEDGVTCCFSIRDLDDREVFATDKQSESNRAPGTIGRHVFRFTMSCPRLLPGSYKIAGEIWDNKSSVHVKYAQKRRLIITSEKFEGGGVVSIPYVSCCDTATLEQRQEDGTLNEAKDVADIIFEQEDK